MLSAHDRGAVALAPLRYNRSHAPGRIFFRLAAYNHSARPLNFGPENVTVQLDDGTPVPVETFDSMRHAALVRAEFAQAVAGVAAVVGTVAAIREDNPYRSARMRQDVSNFHYAASVSIADRLQREVETADGVILQTTTIDPDSFFAGGIIANQPALARSGARSLLVTVNFGGEQHRYRLFVAPEGVPMPAHATLPAVGVEDMEGMHRTPQTWLFGSSFPSNLTGTDGAVVRVGRY